MLVTKNTSSFDLSESDSTVFIQPGSAQIGSYVMSFRGGNIPFSELTSFDTTTYTTNGYIQHAVVSLINSNNFPDITGSYLAPVPSESYLTSFNADPYSKPLWDCIFSYDGTTVSLKNSARIY